MSRKSKKKEKEDVVEEQPKEFGGMDAGEGGAGAGAVVETVVETAKDVKEKAGEAEVSEPEIKCARCGADLRGLNLVVLGEGPDIGKLFCESCSKKLKTEKAEKAQVMALSPEDREKYDHYHREIVRYLKEMDKLRRDKRDADQIFNRRKSVIEEMIKVEMTSIDKLFEPPPAQGKLPLDPDIQATQEFLEKDREHVTEKEKRIQNETADQPSV